jgi:hypothetical protein
MALAAINKAIRPATKTTITMRLNAVPDSIVCWCCPIIFVSFLSDGFAFTPRLWQVRAGTSSR